MFRHSMLLALIATGFIGQYASADLAPMPRRAAMPQARLGVWLKEYDDGEHQGMLVTGVEKGGPATKLLHLRDGTTWYLEANVDVILGINGMPVTDMASYRYALAHAGPNPVLTVWDKRAKEVIKYKARLPQSSLRGALNQPESGTGTAITQSSLPIQQVMMGGFLATALASCGYLLRRKKDR